MTCSAGRRCSRRSTRRAPAALRALITEVDLARGQRLFDEGDAGDRLYVILDGKIKLTRAAPDGRENLLSVLGPGEMFGELSLFDPRPAHRERDRGDRHPGWPRSPTTTCGTWLTGRPDVARCTCCRRWPSGCAGPTT